MHKENREINDLLTKDSIAELKYFLSEHEITLISRDIENLKRNFYNEQDKSYLNLFVNLFLRYRINPVSIEQTIQKPYYYLGFGLGTDNEFLVKNQSSNDSLDFEIIYFNSLDLQFTKNEQIELFYEYVDYLKDTMKEKFLDKDLTLSSISEKAIDSSIAFTNVFDRDGVFYKFFNIKYEERKKKLKLPAVVSLATILEGVKKCLRFYAIYRSFNQWNNTYSLLFSRYLDITKIEELNNELKILNWFFNDHEFVLPLVNTQSAKYYEKWVQSCRQGILPNETEAVKKLEFNSNLTFILSHFKELVTNSLVCQESQTHENPCLSPVLEPFFTYFLTNNPLSATSALFEHKDVIIYFKRLKEFLTTLNMDFESEKWQLSISSIATHLVHLTVVESNEGKIGLKMPFLNIYKPDIQQQTSKLSSLQFTESDRQLFNFLTSYSKGEMNINDFKDFISNIQHLNDIQKKLIKIRDIPAKRQVFFEGLDHLQTLEDAVTLADLHHIDSLKQNSKRLIILLHHLWFQIITVDPLFKNNNDFTKIFQMMSPSEIKKGFNIVSIFDNYLKEWNGYKKSSPELLKLNDELKTVSQLKYDLEGLKLSSRKFFGAVSFIKARRLMEKERKRMIDIVLRELVNIMINYHYNDDIQIKLDLYELSMDDQKLVSSAIEIVEQVQLFKNQIIIAINRVDVFKIMLEYISHIKGLLGSNYKITQLSRYIESFSKWFSKLREDDKLVLVGLNIKNFDAYLKTLIRNVDDMNIMVTKFYQHSLTRECLQLISHIAETKNLSKVFSTIAELNKIYSDTRQQLSNKLVGLSSLSKTFIQITDEIFITYKDLIDVDDFKDDIKTTKLKWESFEDSLIITEKIKDTDSLLEKQLYIEKSYRLIFLLNSTFSIISHELSKDFQLLVKFVEFKDIKTNFTDISINKRLEFVHESVAQITAFLNSVQIPSRRNIQILKVLVFSTPRIISKLEINSVIRPQIEAIVDLSYSFARRIKDLHLLRELVQILHKLNRKITSSIHLYLLETVFDEVLLKSLKERVTLDESEPNFNRNYLKWILKIQIILSITDFSQDDLLASIDSKIKAIQLDKTQEKIIEKYISLSKKAPKISKDKTSEKIELKKKVQALESQISNLQHQLQNMQKKSEPSIFTQANEHLSSPVLLEKAYTELQKGSYGKNEKFDKLAAVQKILQSSKPDQLNSTFDEEEFFDDFDSDLVRVVLRDVDEENRFEEEDELNEDDLPAVDLIRELRSLKHKKLDNLAKMHRQEPVVDSRARDMISEIEDYLEEDHSSTRVEMYNRRSFAYPIPKIKVAPLIDEENFDVSKISGRYMPGLLPKHLFNSESANVELKQHLENIENLKRQLEEQLNNNSEQQTELASIISDYLSDEFGDQEQSEQEEQKGEEKSSFEYKDLPDHSTRSKKAMDETDVLLSLKYSDLESLENQKENNEE